MVSKILFLDKDAMPGKTQKLKEALLQAVLLSRKEKGCLFYDLYQDPREAGRFAVLMCFKNQEAYDAHVSAPYIQDLEKFDKLLYCNANESFFQKISP